VQCAIYVQNRCPHAKLNEKTPQEVWSGRKPSVSHLKVFDSIAYGHVPTQQRTKLEDQSKKYVFIRYDEKTKAYKLFNLITKKMIMSRDVQVDEESEWKWNYLEKESRSLEIDIPLVVRDHETSDEEDEPLQPRARNLQDIYNSTDEVHVICFLADSEDLSFEEVVHEEKWQKAMNEEIGTIERNNMWELTDLSKGARPIGVKWVYKKKTNVDGEVERYKAEGRNRL